MLALIAWDVDPECWQHFSAVQPLSHLGLPLHSTSVYNLERYLLHIPSDEAPSSVWHPLVLIERIFGLP